MNSNIVSSLGRNLGKIGLKLKKHSPEILVLAGAGGTVVAGVMACKATTKISEIKEETDAQLEIIAASTEAGEINTENGVVPYTEEDAINDTRIVYVQSALKYVKLYAPSVIVGGLSIGAILTGHNITRKRNIALSAAYLAVDKSFKNYRDNVIERFGEKLDKELKYGIKAKEFEEIVVDENGKEKVSKSTVDVVENPDKISDYAKFYDDGCNGWCKDPEHNLSFLKRQEAYANEKLKKQGYLFLNEVYKMLGIPCTKAGQIVGWIYDEKNPIGDNYVDFGIYDSNRQTVRDFVNGYERTILLDFNVDGNILDLI